MWHWEMGGGGGWGPFLWKQLLSSALTDSSCNVLSDHWAKAKKKKTSGFWDKSFTWRRPTSWKLSEDVSPLMMPILAFLRWNTGSTFSGWVKLSGAPIIWRLSASQRMSRTELKGLYSAESHYLHVLLKDQKTGRPKGKTFTHSCCIFPPNTCRISTFLISHKTGKLLLQGRSSDLHNFHNRDLCPKIKGHFQVSHWSGSVCLK